MTNTNNPSTSVPTNLSTSQAVLAPPPAHCPVAPPLEAQTFRDEPVLRRPLPSQAAGAPLVLAELSQSPLLSIAPGMADLAVALASATAWREERRASEAWTSFVTAADAYAWNRVLEIVADSSDYVALALKLHPELAGSHVELVRMLKQRRASLERGTRRRQAKAKKLAKKEVTPAK